MALENCPKCGNDLAPPLSSGRQVCMSCGWSDRPKKAAVGGNAAPGVHAASLSPETRKLLSALCHGSIFLSSIAIVPIVIPIVLYFASNDSVVKANAGQSIKFQIYGWLAAISLGLVMLLAPFLILLIALLFLALGLIYIILPILAIVHCFTSDEPYVYPLI